MRGPCQLFDFTGARADQCLKLKYISEGEGSGPQGVKDRKLDKREAPPLAFQEIQKPQVYFLEWVTSGLVRTSWLCSLSSISCSALASLEQRDARWEAGSERNLGLGIVF